MSMHPSVSETIRGAAPTLGGLGAVALGFILLRVAALTESFTLLFVAFGVMAAGGLAWMGHTPSTVMSRSRP